MGLLVSRAYLPTDRPTLFLLLTCISSRGLNSNNKYIKESKSWLQADLLTWFRRKGEKSAPQICAFASTRAFHYLVGRGSNVRSKVPGQSRGVTSMHACMQILVGRIRRRASE